MRLACHPRQLPHKRGHLLFMHLRVVQHKAMPRLYAVAHRLQGHGARASPETVLVSSAASRRKWAQGLLAPVPFKQF
jgi:hypothetical protein